MTTDPVPSSLPGLRAVPGAAPSAVAPAPNRRAAAPGTRRARRTALLASGLVAGAVLTGCSSAAGVQEAAATGTPAPSADAAAASTAPDLAAQLLPAEAFGPDATVFPLPAEQLTGGGLPGGGLPGAGVPADVQVGPPACTAALQALSMPQPPAAEDVAAQVAVQGTTYTGQLLAVAGTAADLVAAVPELVEQCAQGTVDSPAHGSATVDLATFDVPDLGDAAVGVAVDLAADEPGGASRTASALVGLVRTGDRVLALATADRTGAAPDRARFTALLEQAHRAQAD